MLVVAAAVGVASCFGAPISGERACEASVFGIHDFYAFARAISVLLTLVWLMRFLLQASHICSSL